VIYWDVFDCLKTELRDVPDRHRSIRAFFASSWNQLSETEKEIFISLSVFRRGFKREAAQVVAGANLRILLALVNKSLLRRDPKSARYGIHELLRQYAGEQLDAAQLNTQTRNAHCAYYTRFMEERLPAMLGPGQVEAFDEIDAWPI
jgi:predicted ATPase